MKKNTIYLFLTLFTIYCQPTIAQVTIGTVFSPRHGSALDLKENDNIGVNSTRGMLLPRVALEDVVKMGPCVQSNLAQSADKQSHIGLTVYNTTDAPEVGLCPGVYVWTGDQWKRIPEPCNSTIDPQLLYAPNCYIVGPGEDSEEIPIAKAYLVSESRSDITDLSRADKVYLNVLWQDTQNLIDKVEFVGGDKGIYSKFKVTAKGTTKGNALVALHLGPNGNDTDPIAWSWHIWVTDYDPNGGGTTYTFNNTEKEYVFMDRNIGAISTTPTDRQSLGMMYQWGRKDPFTAAEEDIAEGNDANWSYVFRPLYSHPGNALLDETNEDENGTGTPSSSGTGIKHTTPPSGSSNLESSIQNPLAYYYGAYLKNDTDFLFDWCSGDAIGANSDNELWGTDGQKSPFDPCPAGWRVPAYSTSKSPWSPYVGGALPPWLPNGINIINGNGYTFAGRADAAQLGYYPSCFHRAPKAYFTSNFVGPSNNFPNSVGGSFYMHGYETGSGIAMTQAYYWSSSVSDNISAKMMSLTVDGVMGGADTREQIKSKGTGAFVRCVKE